MSTTPATPGHAPDDGTRRDAEVNADAQAAEGTVDPFQEPDFVAEQLPDGDELTPGTAQDPGTAGSGRPETGRHAQGPGSDSTDEDADRFDAG